MQGSRTHLVAAGHELLQLQRLLQGLVAARALLLQLAPPTHGTRLHLRSRKLMLQTHGNNGR